MKNIIQHNDNVFQRFDTTNLSDIMYADIFHDMDTDEVKYPYVIVSTDGVSPAMTSKLFFSFLAADGVCSQFSSL